MERLLEESAHRHQRHVWEGVRLITLQLHAVVATVPVAASMRESSQANMEVCPYTRIVTGLFFPSSYVICR